MTQLEKQLLLTDLCARLPYKVKCSITKKGVVRELKPMNNGISMPVNQVRDVTVKKTLNTDIISDFVNDNIVLKPYLRPIHKLTKEELEELEFLTDSDYVDYCNEHHIDYRNLIPKGLALEAPEGMYKTE